MSEPMRKEDDDEDMSGDDVRMEDDPSIQRKGRGFDPRSEGQGPSQDGVKHRGAFDVLNGKADASSSAVHREDDDAAAKEVAARSIEGWIVIVSGIDEEATEEEVIEKFADFGKVRNCHLNLDRRTGYVKGYALLEFDELKEAKEAVNACRDGLTLMDKPLKADFAFLEPPPPPPSTAAVRHVNTTERGAAARNRSRSPSSRRRQ